MSLTPPPGYGLLKDDGKTMAWTPDAKKGTPDAPRIVLARSPTIYTDQVKRQREPVGMLHRLTYLAQVSDSGPTALTIDGMPAYETTATALASANNAPVRAYCVSVFAADCTLYVVAYGGGEQATENIELFRTAAKSLSFK